MSQPTTRLQLDSCLTYSAENSWIVANDSAFSATLIFMQPSRPQLQFEELEAVRQLLPPGGRLRSDLPQLPGAFPDARVSKEQPTAEESRRC